MSILLGTILVLNDFGEVTMCGKKKLEILMVNKKLFNIIIFYHYSDLNQRLKNLKTNALPLCHCHTTSIYVQLIHIYVVCCPDLASWVLMEKRDRDQSPIRLIFLNCSSNTLYRLVKIHFRNMVTLILART